MNLKKICSLVLLFAINFSIVHDYAFARSNDNHYSANTCISEVSPVASNGTTDKSCKIHIDHHAAYLFSEKSAYIPIIKRGDDLFAYNEIFFSLNYFNFFKPPIA